LWGAGVFPRKAVRYGTTTLNVKEKGNIERIMGCAPYGFFGK
jgi:hypothetical protein